jgi:hypothetical protein
MIPMEVIFLMRSEAPSIHSQAVVLNTRLGCCVEVAARTQIVESVVGDYSYIMNDGDVIYTRMGKFCSIASHVRINPGNHPLERAALHHFTYRSAQYGLGDDDEAFFDWRRGYPVLLGHDVWIGHGAVVLPGVTIGTGAAIGAGSIVTRNVPAFAIVAGNPARIIRERFPHRIQEGLLQLAWWDWPREALGAALDDFRSLSAEAFVNRYRHATVLETVHQQ